VTGRRGAFIVVEGPEGSGKSTLVAGLSQRMLERGIDPVRVREPGGTPVAEAVRLALLDPNHQVAPIAELFLFLAARADLVARVIAPALAEGKVVVADRFAMSTDVYQGRARGIDPALVRRANESAVAGVVPDITLVVDVPADIGLRRQRDGGLVLDRLDQEHLDFHQQVAEAYKAASGPGVVHMDGTVSPEVLLDGSWEILAAKYPETFGVVEGSV
jgi:dTMP kinase